MRGPVDVSDVMWCCCADLHAQVGDADARQGAIEAARGEQAAPVPAMPQVLLIQPPARPAHQGTHRRKALQVLLL